MLAKLLNCPTDTIYFGLVIVSYDYYVTTIFAEQIVSGKKC